MKKAREKEYEFVNSRIPAAEKGLSGRIAKRPGFCYNGENQGREPFKRERFFMEQELKEALFGLLAEKGAGLMGAANLSGVAGAELPVGVAVAVPLPPKIVRDLQSAPTLEYYAAYHALNEKLDGIVSCGAAFLRERGYAAAAHTTKTVRKDADWRTPLPHKTVAARAGLGWIGKSCLLVTEEYGSAVRLSSLVTDALLPPDRPASESRCGSCTVCVRSCPGRALTGALWTPEMPREALFRKEDCKKAQIERMKKATGMETDLCGLCFAVCPYTRRYLARATGRGL